MALTPNMNLPIATVGVTQSPDWAEIINQSMSLIDQHNHASGNGVPIDPSGMNISSDLDFLSNNAIGLRSVRFNSQVSPLSGVMDLDCAYVSGVDLYYNDGNGNQVRITQGGNVAGSSGSISGLTSPASASYVAGNATFVWQSNANTPANMDNGSVIIREVLANAKGITLASPSSLAADYTLTFPGSLPTSQHFATIDNSGNIGVAWAPDNLTIDVASNLVEVKDLGISTAKIADLAVTTAKIAALAVTTAKIADAAVTNAKIADDTITPAKLAAKVILVSSPSGLFTTSSTTFVNVTNLSVALGATNSTGRPVQIIMEPSDTANSGFISALTNAVNPNAIVYIDLQRSVNSGGSYTSLRFWELGGDNIGTPSKSLFYSPNSISYLDPRIGDASTVYRIRARIDSASAGAINVFNCQLKVYPVA